MPRRSPWPVLGLFLLQATVGTAWISPAALKKQLLNGSSYDPDVPPHQAFAGWRTSNATTVITFGMWVHSFLGADLDASTISIVARITLTWIDPRLKYNGTAAFGPAWGRQKFITLPTVQKFSGDKKLWTPPVSTPWQGNCMSNLADNDAWVAEDGEVVWNRFGPLTIPDWGDSITPDFPYGGLTIDVYFTHSADLGDGTDFGIKFKVGDVGGWPTPKALFYMSIIGAAVVHYDRAKGDFDYRANLTKQDFNNPSVMGEVLQNRKEACDLEVVVLFRLETLPCSYIANIIVPVCFMVVFQTFGLWLPLDTGERTSYSSTIVLTVLAIMLFTAGDRPKTPYLTYLDRLQALALILCFIPLLASVFLTWLMHATKPAASTESAPGPESAPSAGAATPAHQPTQVLRTVATRTGISAEGIDDCLRHTYPFLAACFVGSAMWRAHAQKPKLLATGYDGVILTAPWAWMSASVAGLIMSSFIYLYVRFLRKYCACCIASPASKDGVGGEEGANVGTELTERLLREGGAGRAEEVDIESHTAVVKPEVAVNQEAVIGGHRGEADRRRVQPEVAGNTNA